MRLYTILVILSLFLFSCSKESSLVNVSQTNFDVNTLQVGQKALYVLYVANLNNVSEFKYQKDTIVWEVVSVKGNKIKIKEYLSANSASLHGNNLIAHADEVFTFEIDKSNVQIHYQGLDVRKSSRILFNLFQLDLKTTQLSSPLVKLSGWQPNSTIDSGEGVILKSTIANTTYDQLNIIVQNAKLSTENIGTYFIYAPNGSIVRTLQYNTFNQIVFGWDLIQ